MLDLGVHLGIEYLGYRAVPAVCCEWETYAAAVLLARMEDASMEPCPIWCDDLAGFDGRLWRGAVDIAVAGLPCQPYSVAGKQRGNADERSFGDDGGGPLGHFLRIVDEMRPALVFLENVPAWVVGGWFREFGEQLSGLGYEIEDPLFVAAEDVGASHRRERVFILAHAAGRKSRIGRIIDDERRWSKETEQARMGNCALAQSARGGLGELRQPSRSDRQLDGRSESVEDAECSEPRAGDRGIEIKSSGQLRDRLANSGDEMGHAGRPGLQGARSAIAERRNLAVAPDGDGRIFAPGPGDFDGWNRVIADGEFDFRAPAVKPGVRVLADGISLVVDASRADQLRCVGNGCVPLQAAVAFVELMRRAIS